MNGLAVRCLAVSTVTLVVVVAASEATARASVPTLPLERLVRSTIADGSWLPLRRVRDGAKGNLEWPELHREEISVGELALRVLAARSRDVLCAHGTVYVGLEEALSKALHLVLDEAPRRDERVSILNAESMSIRAVRQVPNGLRVEVRIPLRHGPTLDAALLLGGTRAQPTLAGIHLHELDSSFSKARHSDAFVVDVLPDDWDEDGWYGEEAPLGQR